MSFWCDDTIRVHIAGPEGEREVLVEQPYALVGYGSRSSVVLEGPGVRKRALLLWATKLGVYAVNLDRAEAPAEQPGFWITGEEPIAVGPYELRARLGSGRKGRAEGPDLVAGRLPLPIPVLHVFGGGLLKDRRRLRHPLTLAGRRPRCSLQLRGEQVSSYHTAFYWQDQRLWCIDLMSGNGTLVAGEPVACRELLLNDQLEIGDFQIVYYRWSPRHTTPGMEHLAAEKESAVADAPDDEISPPPERAATVAPLDEAAIEQRLAAEMESRLAEERKALMAAQAEWAAERLRLEAEVQRLAGQLEAAAATGAASEASPPEAAADEPKFEIEEKPEVTSGEEAEDALPVIVEPSSAVESEANAAENASQAPLIEVKTGSRRRSQPKGDLTAFVSGRLSDLEHSHRRRMLVIWGSALAGTVALVMAALGIWSWLF